MTLDTPGSLRGQKALVTGATSGLGAGIAMRLARAGAAVAINYRSDRAEAERMAEEIRREGGEALPVGADVSRETEVEAMFEAAIAAFGRLDIVVPNAGIQKDAAFSEMTLDEWNAVLAVNLTGYFLTARAAVRQFLKQDHKEELSRAAGKLIFVSSVHEAIPWAGHVNYASSKGGVMQLTKSLAQEVSERRIRVNAIAPGAIKTSINQAAWETPEAEAALLKLIPYGRVGDPGDVAEAALWLASDASDYVVGTTLFVDGGMMLYPAFRDGG